MKRNFGAKARLHPMLMVGVCVLAMGVSLASGGAQDHNNWTNYFKPYPPDNAIVKVKVEGATDYGTPDRDHKYCLDGYWDGSAENGVNVRLLYVTQEGYLFSEGCKSNVWETVITNNAQEVYPPDSVIVMKAPVKSGSTDYLTLKAAVDAAKSRARIVLNDSVTLEETLTITNSITLDLNTNVVTLGSTLTNAFHFTAGATVSNGTIVSSLASNVRDSVLMRFTDCKANLKDLTIAGRGYEMVVAHDSTSTSEGKYTSKKVSGTMTCDDLTITGNGCLLYVDYATATLATNCSITTDDAFESFGGSHEAAIHCCGNGKVTVEGGTYASPKVLQSGDLGGRIIVNGGIFNGQIYSLMKVGANADLESYENYTAQFTFNGGTYAYATIAFSDADSRSLDEFTKVEEVVLAAPSGYVWENGKLVGGTPPDSVTPGVVSGQYDDALSATNAAAKINANKANSIVVPTGVEDAAAKTTYLTKVAAVVTSDNCVVVDLTPAAGIEVQTAVDEAIESDGVASALTSTDASVKTTVATTVPGLYYWIVGGVAVDAITESGHGELSTDGGSVELTKPTLDAANGSAFFKIAAGVSPPVQ